jgi:hypothetical protein
MASDAKVNRYIAIWEAAFSRACGQWFEAREAVVTFDGDNTAVAFFQIPIIEVESIEDTIDVATLDADDYKVYSGRDPSFADDRRNPKIVMSNGLFKLGRQRYQITGTFGYLEPDDSAPGDVWYAMIKLIIEKLLTPIVGTSAGLLNAQLLNINGQIALTEEVTDDHKKKWTYTGGKSKFANMGLTSDATILQTINDYRAPMNIRSQTDWTWIERPSDLDILDQVFG